MHAKLEKPLPLFMTNCEGPVEHPAPHKCSEKAFFQSVARTTWPWQMSKVARPLVENCQEEYQEIE
jgi:hypothetical protein